MAAIGKSRHRNSRPLVHKAERVGASVQDEEAPKLTVDPAVKTLGKALTILEVFASSHQPLTVAEVALKAGVTRPTVHRLIQTLVSHGYLTQNARDGRIAPGYSVLRLASALLDTDQLRLESLPYLERLAQSCGERANLGIIHQNQLLYLAGVEKPNLPMLYSQFGKTSPAYCAALGKAILANWDEAHREAYLTATVLEPQTANTITDPDVLRRHLTEIREHGYAFDCEEHNVGVYCLASAIAIRSEVVGAIGVTGRSKEALKSHIQTVQHTAEVISHILSRGT